MLTGDVAESAGVEISTVRFYERRGLLRPSDRTSGNYRWYDDEAPRTIRFIHRAQRLGSTLTEISPVLELRSAPADVLEGLLVAKLVEVDERIADLQRMRAAISVLAVEDVDQDAPCPVVASPADVETR